MKMKKSMIKLVSRLLLVLDKNIVIVPKDKYQKVEKFYTKEELQSFTAEEASQMRVVEVDKQYERVTSLIKDCASSEDSLFVGKTRFFWETLDKLEEKGFRVEWTKDYSLTPIPFGIPSYPVFIHW